MCGEAEESGEDYFIPRVNYDRRIGENSGLGNRGNGGHSRGSRGKGGCSGGSRSGCKDRESKLKVAKLHYKIQNEYITDSL